MSICQIYDLCAETLWLGRYGENGARDIAIDVGRWFADLGTEGTVVLVNWRPGEDDTPYNPNITMDGSKVVWSPSNVDLAISGRGFAELRYYVGNALAKSKTFRTVIDRTPSEGANPPSAAEDWLERMEDAAVTAQTASETAVTAAETATEGAQAVAQALPTVTQAAQTATSAATTATNAATEAAASEEVASAAANAAQTASETATAASQTAVGAASTATTKAAQAVEAAGTATTKASEATQAATTATANAQTSTVKAGEATTAAATATSKATEATTAASTASAAATTASTAASTATSAASTATAAKTAAQTAQTGAETAQGAAESAAASVSASAAQIATNTADISAIKADLLQKANVDGAYSDLTAGNAEQLVSTIYEEDSVPYIFRTAGGSMDIGDREEDMLVGGSVVWNQLLKNGNFEGTTSWRLYNVNYGTLAASDNTLTVEYSVESTGGYPVGIIPYGYDVPLFNGHRYLMSIDAKPDFNTYIGIEIGAGAGTPKATTQNAWNHLAWVSSRPSYSQGTAVLFKPVNAEIVSGSKIQFKNAQFIDLTQMFGSTIADYVYGLETATAGAGVAFFRKYYPNDYYPYDAGTLKSVEGVSAHKTVGFNAWNEEWEVGRYNPSTGVKETFLTTIRSKDYIPIVPDTSYYCYIGSTTIGHVNFCYYDANKNFISFASGTTNPKITPSNAHYMTFYVDSVYGTTYKNDICINLSWDGERDGEYEPYVKHSYPLDSSLTLRGIPKLDSANNLYYDGDTYESDGTVTRRYGVVDLGTLTWAYFNLEGHKRFGAPFSSKPSSRNLICTKYQDVGYSAVFNNTAEGISIHTDGSQVAVYDTAYTDAADFKTAMSGVYLVYELATPTTETAEPYQNPQIVDDFGTEEYVTTSIVPVGHVTKYQPNLRAKLEMSPDSPDGDGDYIVRQADGENSYVSLASTATIQDILARLTALEGNTNEG